MKAEWTNSDSLTISQTTKAILVIDMPSDCTECQFCGRGGRNLEKYVCCLTGEHSEDIHLVGCPLKPLPQKQNNDKEKSWLEYFQTRGASYQYGHIDGWNACLEEIEND